MQTKDLQLKRALRSALLVLLLNVVGMTNARSTLTQAVDFTATDCYGTEVHLFDILDGGQYVLLDFFFSTCGPCQQAAPKVVESYHAFGCNQHDVFYMEISYSDNEAACQNWCQTYGVEFPTISNVAGGTSICNTYGIGAYPTLVLIRPDRQIVIQDLWPFNTAQAIIDALETYGIEQHDCNHLIQAVASPNEAGTISGVGAFMEGQTCTLIAMANEGYAFVNWTKEDEVVSTNPTYSFTVTEDAMLVAHFASTTHYWNYNPYQFSDNMNIVGMVAINGEVLESEYIEVAAFCGEVCHGSDFVIQVEDQYLALMTIGGESGNVLTFRAFDHLNNHEIEGICSYTAVFEANALIGLPPADPVVFDFISETDITQATAFVNGWTWWSTYIEAENADVLGQLKDGLGASGQVIKSQLASTMHLGNNWVGSLTMNNELGYMVKVNDNISVEITGPAVMPEEHPITLNPGWTWIGYPCIDPIGINEALANLTPQTNDVIKSQQQTAMFMMGQWRGALNTLTPGIGLMYKSNSSEPVTLTYAAPSRNNELETNEVKTHWKANYSAYPTNMTVLAVVELDGKELDSDHYELAAFANGESRGAVRLMYVEPLDRHFALLTIAGDEASELTFGLYDTETSVVETVCTPSLQFEADAVVGTPEEPFIVSFRGNTGVDEWANALNIFPNPVERGQTFSLGLTDETGAVQVEIVNALGAVVETQNYASLHTITAPKVAGVYTLRITVKGKGSCYKKLIVK